MEKKLGKLIAEKGMKWSFVDGLMIFGNVVWASKEDICKYTLLNENNEVVKANPMDYFTFVY